MKETTKKVFKKIGTSVLLVFAVLLCVVSAITTYCLYGGTYSVEEIPIARYENPDDPWDKTMTGTRVLEYRDKFKSSYMSYDMWEDGTCEVEMGILGTEWNLTFIRNIYSPHSLRYNR